MAMKDEETVALIAAVNCEVVCLKIDCKAVRCADVPVRCAKSVQQRAAKSSTAGSVSERFSPSRSRFNLTISSALTQLKN